MIPNIWTLQAASGGDEKTLSGWGFTSASITSANQGASTLSLPLSLEDAVAHEDLWTWEQELILRRSGSIYWRGYVDGTPRSLSPQSESVGYTIRNHWWLLEQLTYRQSWTALQSSGALGPVSTGRVSLARDEAVPTAAVMFAELSAFCLSMGVTLTVDTSALSDQALPLIEAHNVTVADLIRSILRWFPGVTLVPVYGISGTSYKVLPATSAEPEVIVIGGRALESLRIQSLPSQQVDAVQIIYETTAPHSEYEAGSEETIGGFLASNALVAATDTFPIGATLTRKSLPITLPHPQLPLPPEPQKTYHPVTAETYPENGAVDAAAERWWLDKSGLAALGLTVDAILLTTGTTGETAHRVILDPSEPPEEAPSPINPSSTPVWRPDAVTDVPRELISGALSDWMNVKAVKLFAEATIGISKTAVDALTAGNKAAFLRKGPRAGKIGSADVWMLDARYTFIGTDAVTKVYERTLSIDSGNVTDETSALEASQAAYLGAVSSAVVPGLAERLYHELSPLRYEGTVTLQAEEVAGTDYLGRRITLSHPDRPEWASMSAMVQQMTADLRGGSVGITFGPPEHLSPQDWVALHEAARKMQDRRLAAASSPQPDESGDLSPGSGGNNNPVVMPQIFPNSAFSFDSGGEQSKMWDLVPDTGENLTLFTPIIIKTDSDVTDEITVTVTPFTPAVDQWVVVTIDDTYAPVVSMVSTWASYPSAYEFDGTDFVKSTIRLWKLVAPGTAGSVPITATVSGIRYVGDGALKVSWATEQITGSPHLKDVLMLR